MRKTNVSTLVAVALCIILLAVPFCIIPARASTTITVTSNPLWTNTGLTISTGEIVSITASGSWSYNTGASGSWTGPNGSPGTTTCSDNFYSGANLGELIAFVGSTWISGQAPPYQGQWGTSFFPQSTGYWAIGSSGGFTSGKSGTLWLGFNDDAEDKATYDNAGSVTAVITITAPSVGGYSFQIGFATLSSVALYLVLVAIVGIGLMAVKRKVKREEKQ